MIIETVITTNNDEFFGLVKFIPPFYLEIVCFLDILLFRKLETCSFNSFLQTKINQLAKYTQPLTRHALINHSLAKPVLHAALHQNYFPY